MKRCSILLSAVAAGVCMAACSGAGADSTSGEQLANADFSESAGAVASSTKNDLTVSLHSLPKETLVRGNNRVQLELRGEDGASSPELDIELETYMPAMGHGPSQQPELVEVSANRYTFDNVVLNMPGLWELHVHLSGDLRDELVFEFDVD